MKNWFQSVFHVYKKDKTCFRSDFHPYTKNEKNIRSQRGFASLQKKNKTLTFMNWVFKILYFHFIDMKNASNTCFFFHFHQCALQHEKRFRNALFYAPNININ